MEKKVSQNEKVLKYMEKFGSITPIQAFYDLGVMRLASRIKDLKESGHKIASEMETSVNRFGETVKYAKYSLAK